MQMTEGDTRGESEVQTTVPSSTVVRHTLGPDPRSRNAVPASDQQGEAVSTTESAQATPVDLGRRLAAVVLDGAVVSGLITAAYLVIGIIAFLLASLGASAGVLNVVSTVLLLAIVAGIAAYYLLPLGRTGQTLGKRILGIRVIDNTGGGSIGVGRSFGRYFFLWLMGLPCYLGYLSVFLDKSGWHRGWHDSMARTKVVTAEALPFGAAVRATVDAIKG